jgi:hypothetical protein
LKDGAPYDEANLSGAQIDCDHALLDAGFVEQDPLKTADAERTGDVERMVLYRYRPGWSPVEGKDVVCRLEHAWAERGAFRHEAHSIAVDDDLVALDFVTWWDGGLFYTGRIEVMLPEL